MFETKKLWELYPPEVAEIAKKERIFNLSLDKVMMPSSQTNAFYMRFIEMVKASAQNPEAFPPITEEKVAIAKSFVCFAAVAEAKGNQELAEKNLEYVELTWPAYQVKMLASPAFANWVFEAGVLFSFYLYCFYIDVDGFLGFDQDMVETIKPQTSYQMDTAYGEYHDVLGNLREIPETDAAMWHCVNSSLWRDVRGRGPFASFYLHAAGRGALVSDLCCGAFNLERRFGYLDAGLCQKVVGYDTDPNALAVATKMLGRSPEECGLKLYNETFFNAFTNPELVGKTDFVMMNGGMSYNVPKTKEILLGVRKLLKTSTPGETPKRFVFNTEVMTVDMAHALYVLGLKNQHESLEPDKSVEESADRINSAIAEVGGFVVEKIITDVGFYGKDAGIAPTFVQFVLDAV